MATNREVLIQELTNPSEFPIEDYLECPYYRDEDCLNDKSGFKVDSAGYNENCRVCKMAWLEKEWDE